MSHGWICVHRQLVDNPIFKNDKLFRVFMYCLLKASHTDHDQLVGDSIVNVKCGQLLTGRKAISSGTGLTEQNVRTAVSKLEKMGILTINSTNKFSIISVVNWFKYQQTNQQPTSNQPASNHQVTTNNNGNNGNNGNNSEGSASEPKAPTKKRSRKKPVTDFPENFEVTPEMADWFFEQQFDERLDLGRATQKWADAMRAKGNQYADWKRAWMTGMRNANEWLGSR